MNEIHDNPFYIFKSSAKMSAIFVTITFFDEDNLMNLIILHQHILTVATSNGNPYEESKGRRKKYQ